MGGVYRFWAVNAPKRRLERPAVLAARRATADNLPMGGGGEWQAERGL